jgi:hypothetical protein
MPRGQKPQGDHALSNAERQARCHVRFQGVRTQNSTRFFSSRSNFSDAGMHGGGRALSDG